MKEISQLFNVLNGEIALAVENDRDDGLGLKDENQIFLLKPKLIHQCPQ